MMKSKPAPHRELDQLLRRLELVRETPDFTRDELYDEIQEMIVELKHIIDFVLPRETAR
jgi:hypothetical protein